MSDADEVLIARSRRGDREAFEELVRRTGRLVYARAYLETGNADRAEDLTQQTFLIAWKSVGQVNEARGFRSWLMKILHSALVDAVRREGRRKRQGQGVREKGRGADGVADGNAGPVEAAQKREESAKALAVLRGLPAEYRDVLMLRYLAGADYETISRQLALSNGSLRGLLSRGMAMLRAEMQKSEKKS